MVVLIFRMWDFNFGTWISHSGLHMIQEARDFIVSEGHGHPLVKLVPKNMLFQLLGAISQICQNFNQNGHVSQIEQLEKP